MLNTQPLDQLPLWGVYVLTVIVLLLSLEGGLRLGTYYKSEVRIKGKRV
jgi:hypothetical protein